MSTTNPKPPPPEKPRSRPRVTTIWEADPKPGAIESVCDWLLARLRK